MITATTMITVKNTINDDGGADDGDSGGGGDVESEVDQINTEAKGNKLTQLLES